MENSFVRAHTSLAGDVTTAANRRLTFATEWHFRPDGVEEVYRRVNQSLLSENLLGVNYSWNESDSTFRVSCNPGHVSQVWQLFTNVLHYVIKTELLESLKADAGYDEDDSYTDFGDDIELISTKIERLDVWRKTHSLARAQASTSTSVNTPVASHHGPAVSALAPVIQSFEARSIWTVESTRFLKKCNSMILAELQRLTGCTLSKQPNGIQVGGPSQANVDLVLQKLDNMYLNEGVYIVNHLFYTEDVEDVRFIIQPFVDIEAKYFRRTLLDNQHSKATNDMSSYGNLRAALKIRCCIFSPPAVKYTHTKVRAELPEFSGDLSCWSTFTYPAKGSSEDDPRKFVPAVEFISQVKNTPLAVLQINQAPNLVEQKQATLDWVNQVQPQSPTPFGILVGSHMRSISSSAGQLAQTGNTEASRPAWDTYIEHDINDLLHTPQQRAEYQMSLTLGATPVSPRQSQSPVSQPSVSTLRARAANMFAFTPSAGSAGSPISLGIPTRSMTPAFAKIQSSSMKNLRELRSCQLDDDISTLNFEALEPSRPLPVTASLFASTSTLRANNQNIAADSTQVLELNTPSVGGKFQPSSEIDTRQFQNNMNQKVQKSNQTQTPKKSQTKKGEYSNRLEVSSVPSSPIEKPEAEARFDIPEFENSLKRAFLTMMEALRGVRGEVTVQVEFGRILLKNFSNRTKIIKKGDDKYYNRHSDKSYEDTQLLAEFRHPDEPNTFFTKVLTISSAECQCLVKMKDHLGNALWPTNDTLSVTYRFYFSDTRSKVPQFIIDIDAENFTAQVKTYKEWGNIYIHGTRRLWDFRISANGFPNRPSLNETHYQLVDQIARTLFIQSNMQTPELYFELDDRLDERYEIEELQVRRESEYKSQDHMSKLKITEIHSLLIKKREISERESSIYQATLDKSDMGPTEKLSSWYEAAISSPQLAKELKENVRMELGDIAAWSAESVVPFAPQLYVPACIILKQIDFIGQANENGLDPTFPEEVLHIAAPKRSYSFW